MSHREDEVRAVIWGVEVRLVSREAKGHMPRTHNPPETPAPPSGPRGRLSKNEGQ